MSDWVVKIGGAPQSREALARLHRHIMRADKLRPHTVLENMNPTLLNAENHVIIAPNEDALEAAIVKLIHALKDMKLSDQRTKQLVDDWLSAREPIAKEQQMAFYTR